MSKRAKQRSNHKPRGRRLHEYQAGELVRAALNAYLAVHLPEWQRDNRIELIWQFSGDGCDECGCDMLRVLAKPLDGPITLCPACWATEPVDGATARQ